jgi:lysophospholipase L1-like esterase
MVSVYIWVLAFWLVVLLFGIWLRRKKSGKNLLKFAYVLLVLFMIEGVCLLALKVKSGYWLFQEKYNLNAEIFKPHPYLIGVPRENARLNVNGVQYTNNSMGFRGDEMSPQAAAKRIVSIGGSTTYGTSVNDWETWPYYLDSLAGHDFEVLNLGVSGHSSVEHIIQASLIVPEFKPDLAIVHCGLNDLRSAYIKDLKSDYSDFHAPNLYGALGFCPLNHLPRLGMLRVAVLLAQKIHLYPTCDYYAIAVDKSEDQKTVQRALKLYERNLTTLVTVLKKQNIDVVLVPQLLCKEAFQGNKLKWWIPYVEDEELEELMAEYNFVMGKVAEKEDCIFAEDILEHEWIGKDFIDPSHLNAEANCQFAEILSSYVIQEEKTNSNAEIEP